MELFHGEGFAFNDASAEIVERFLESMKTRERITTKASDCGDLRKFIGRKIADARNKKGLTQKQLADKISMSKSRLAFLETGDLNRIDVLCKIAEVLQKPVAWFFQENDENALVENLSAILEAVKKQQKH